MKVIVTGGTGSVGRGVVPTLLESGHDVTLLGRRENQSVPGAVYHRCDVVDFDDLVREFRGADAVVHLAAMPNPEAGPDQAIFHVNDCGTFNVYQAAKENSIRRVVTASSINALGYFYGLRGFPIRYLPVDENHETHTTDTYSFSKVIMEQVGDYFWRQAGISSVSLRLPWVYHAADRRAGSGKRAAYERELLAQPPNERTRRLEDIHERYDLLRSKRPRKLSREERREVQDELMTKEELSFMNAKANFWSSLDDRDAGQAVLKGIEADYEGSHTMFVVDNRNWAGLPVADLAKLFIPPVGEVRETDSRDTSVVSIERARSVIGFEPEYHLKEE
jgi:nucleoside-diphosphate-sugar epimerase